MVHLLGEEGRKTGREEKGERRERGGKGKEEKEKKKEGKSFLKTRRKEDDS